MLYPYDIYRNLKKNALTVIASLGGGGAIVFGLSGFLGKLWADRALEAQKQQYAQLNLSFTHQLELASKQVQAELDRVLADFVGWARDSKARITAKRSEIESQGQ